MAIVEIKAEITGNVWKIVAAVGDTVDEDQEILILESMKMEIPVVGLRRGPHYRDPGGRRRDHHRGHRRRPLEV